jgi:signal peptidase I
MNSWRDVLSGVRMLASAGVYAILIVTFGFQAARVEGFSMEPTLQDRDRLIINRLRVSLWRSASRRHRHALLTTQSGDAVRQPGDCKRR